MAVHVSDMPRFALLPAAILALYATDAWRMPLSANLVIFDQHGQAAQPNKMVHTPEAPQKGPAQNNGAINQASDGLFYVDATVNGKVVHFVVDTGASVVVLTTADAARVGIVANNGSRIGVETAGGAASMHSTNVGSMMIAGQTLNNVDAAVMRDNLPVSLLGQSALSRLRSVAIHGGNLQIN